MSQLRLRLSIAVASAALVTIAGAGSVLGGDGGATVTHEPITLDDCHPDTDPVTGETFLTCTTGSGFLHVVLTPAGNTITSQHVVREITVTGETTGFVSHSTAREHQQVVVTDDPDNPQVLHSGANVTTTTTEDTCHSTTIFQFANDEVRTNFSTPMHCRPAG